MKYLNTPLTEDDIKSLQVGDMVTISGNIYTGRDAVLPRIVSLSTADKLKDLEIDLKGSIIFHTAVSVAGIGPTSSNKIEIENSIEPLSKMGVKMHLGKGAISKKTIKALEKSNSVFAIIPPVTALLESKTLNKKVLAFPEEGMEAFHKLEVNEVTVIIAAAHGLSIY